MTEEPKELQRTVGGVPVAAIEAPERLADGQTKIHKHPDCKEIVQKLAICALTPADRRRSMREVERDLIAEYDLDLDGSGSYTNWFMKEYVAPAMVLTPDFVRRAIYEANVDVNIPLKKMEVLERLLTRYERASRDPESRDSDIAAIARTLLDGYGKVEDSLERFQMYPSKTSSTTKNVVNFDVAGVLGTLQGRKAHDDSIDVDFDLDEEE